LLAFAAAMTTAAAFAGTTPNFHNAPTCAISGTGTTSASTTCTGTLFGVGNLQLQAQTIVSGFAVYTCQNPGGNTAPGQSQVTQGPSQSQPVALSASDRNGSATFTTNANTLTAAATIPGNQAGCPNGNWTGVTPKITITSVELKIFQGGTTFYDCSASNSSGLPASFSLPKSC
jgi:hypothetical protein